MKSSKKMVMHILCGITATIPIPITAATFMIHNFGIDNTFAGEDAGNFTLTIGNAEGNTSVGKHALAALTVGSENTAVGAYAGAAIADGYANTIIGDYAGSKISSGNTNTCVGAYAGGTTTTGNNNSLFGYAAGGAMATASDNTCIGSGAGSTATGDYNTLIGRGAGASIGAGTRNVFLGSYADAPAGISNSIVIGVGVAAYANNQIRIGFGTPASTNTFIDGIRNTTTGMPDAVPVLIDSKGQLGTASSSRRYKENIQPIDNITEKFMALEPVEFNYNSDKTQKTQYGFIAEEFMQQFPELVTRNAQGEPETIQYHLLFALLTKMVQENRQIINTQQAVIENLQQQITMGA